MKLEIMVNETASKIKRYVNSKGVIAKHSNAPIMIIGKIISIIREKDGSDDVSDHTQVTIQTDAGKIRVFTIYSRYALFETVKKALTEKSVEVPEVGSHDLEDFRIV